MIVSNSNILYNLIYFVYTFTYVNIVYYGAFQLVKYYNKMDSSYTNKLKTLIENYFNKNNQMQNNKLETDNSLSSTQDDTSSESSSSSETNSSRYRKKTIHKLENFDNYSVVSSKENSQDTHSYNEKLINKANNYKKELKKAYINYDTFEKKYIVNMDALVNIAKKYHVSGVQNKIICNINGKWFIVGHNIYKQINTNDNLLQYCSEKLKHIDQCVDQIDSKEISFLKLEVLDTNKTNYTIYAITYLD